MCLNMWQLYELRNAYVANSNKKGKKHKKMENSPYIPYCNINVCNIRQLIIV